MRTCQSCSHTYLGSPRRCWVCGAHLRKPINGIYVFWGLLACAALVAFLAHLNH